MDERNHLSEEYGLTEPEILVCQLALGVWRLLDFDAPLWRGPTVYQRFESRIRATAHGTDITKWAWRFATKCHVSPQLLPLEVVRDARALDKRQMREAMYTVRHEPGLVVSAVRALQDRRKKGRAL